MDKRILVVDDEPDIVKVVAFRLKKKGYAVIVAVDGHEGLEKAEKEKPDLILLDLQLPGMNGEEVCAKIRSNQNLKQIPIIFLTASQSVNVKDKAKQLGANDYLIKPFTPEDLFAKVAKHIK